eukprot:139449-Prorocentrum_minimum.AAC.7
MATSGHVGSLSESAANKRAAYQWPLHCYGATRVGIYNRLMWQCACKHTRRSSRADEVLLKEEASPLELFSLVKEYIVYPCTFLYTVLVTNAFGTRGVSSLLNEMCVRRAGEHVRETDRSGALTRGPRGPSAQTRA